MNMADGNILVEDVLMEIFSYLDAEDVLNCEMVCLQWNRVVRSIRYNWEELYDRQMKKWHAIWKCDDRHPFWNEVSKLNYLIGHYRVSSLRCSSATIKTMGRINFEDLCRLIHQEIQKIGNNWRTATFHKRIYYFGYGKICSDDDFVVRTFRSRHKKFRVQERGTWNYHAIDEPPDDPSFCPVIQEDLVIFQSGNTLMIFVISSKSKVLEIDHLKDISQVAFKSGVLVVATSETRPVLHLHFWRRVAIDEFDYICRLELRVDNARVELDDRYVAVYGEDPDSANYKIHFVSTRNFQIKKLLEVKKKARFHYNQGIFFVIERVGRIQLYEVLTDQWLHTIKHKRWTTFRHSYKYENAPVRVNSRFMATLDFDGKDSIICIYDFIAAKDPLRDASSLLLATLRINDFRFRQFKMTESELYGVGLVQSSEVKLISIDFHHHPKVDEDPSTDRMECEDCS